MTSLTAPAGAWAGLVRPAGPRAALLFNASCVLAGTILLALSARVAVAIPFSPVPVTGQTFAVLLLGALLGARLGALTVLAYLLEGTLGLPVFAAGGAGPAWLLGPTGGYLLAFVPAAAVIGRLAERGWDRRFGSTALAMAVGTGIILLGGAAWLAATIGISGAVAAGILPFIPGAIVKIALAAALLPAGWRLLSWARARGLSS